MPDLFDLSRRLMAVGYVPTVNMQVLSVLADGTVEQVAGTVVRSLGGLPVVWWPDLRETRAHQPHGHLLPDLTHAGTLGILLGAMGWPSVEFSETIDGAEVCHLSSRRRPIIAHSAITGEGPTRREALAEALVKLAESRGGVKP